MLLASAGLIASSLQLIKTRITSISSVDAVVNGALIDVRAPQDGSVLDIAIDAGAVFQPDQPLMTLMNDRVSELTKQEISSKITDLQAELRQAQALLSQQQRLITTLEVDHQNQRQLETQEANQHLERITAELRGVEAEYRLAQVQQERSAMLVSQGALAQAEWDIAIAESDQLLAEINSLQAQIAQVQSERTASELGLTLNQSRSNYDPRVRLEELQLQIADQQELVKSLEASLQAAQAELAEADADTQRDRTLVVKSPINGVVWERFAQPNQYVQEGDSLAQMLDCSRRWVDVFVEEKALRSLQPGTPATIRLYGLEDVLYGKVSLVRSGLGRLTPGADTAIPLTSNQPRHTQVRVELDSDTQTDPQSFCYVGYTGRVTFQVR